MSLQTVAAPVLTSMLYVLIFANLLAGKSDVYPGVSYPVFLVPGLAIMAALQNAFANTSSSLIQSKMTGNIIFVLLPPLSHWEFFGGYVFAAMVRGIVVGFGVMLVTFPFTSVALPHPIWAICFALVGCGLLGTLGLIAGMLADKIDQVSAFQNFLIMPLTFLSGVFYSIHSLPEFWQQVSHFNPFFYMIDGFRYGFFGASDVAPGMSLAITLVTLGVGAGVALTMLKSGYKLRF